MELKLDTLHFGNPSLTQKLLIEKGNYLVPVFDKAVNEANKLPDIEIQKKEINQIISNISDITTKENQHACNLYKAIDRNLEQWLYNTLKSPRIDVLEKTRQIIDDLDPLIYKLKFYYNRIRPRQFAKFASAKMFPICNYKNDHPSYPSRKTIIGIVVCEVISNLDPQNHNSCMEAKDAIISSRQYLGNNYGSDIEFSKKIASLILKEESFIVKYRI